MKTIIKHYLSLDHEGGISKTVTTTKKKGKVILRETVHFPKETPKSLTINISSPLARLDPKPFSLCPIKWTKKDLERLDRNLKKVFASIRY